MTDAQHSALEAARSGSDVAAALRSARVWGKRSDAMALAARRVTPGLVARLLRDLARLDGLAKGLGRGNVWDELRSFALDQINWILGLNPFDSSMMYGVGRNNPEYMFFDSWEFTNSPGGISNGITSGFKDEDDIDFDLKYTETGADNDWRWQEQWLPHASWFLMAVSARGE